MTIQTKYSVGDTAFVLSGFYEVPEPNTIIGIEITASLFREPLIIYVFKSAWEGHSDIKWNEKLVFESHSSAEEYKKNRYL